MASPQTAPDSAPEFAGLGRRLAAFILDFLIAYSILFLVGFAIRGLRAYGLWSPTPTDPSGTYSPVAAWAALGPGRKSAVLVSYLVSFGLIYLALFESSGWQAGFGKRLLNIYVADAERRPLGLLRALVRSSTKWVLHPFGGSLLSAATIAATTEHKALHDYVARSRVFRGRPSPAAPLAAWRVLAAFAISFLWLLATFLVTL